MRLGDTQFKNRTILLVVGVLAYLLIAYFVIVPTVLAKHYFGTTGSKTARARAELTTVSTGSNVVVFEDPDIPLDKRQKLIAQTLANVQRARASLSDLEQANTLLRLPGTGLNGEYHQAMVREGRTDNAVRQSREVLDNYAVTLSYINTYTSIQLYLDNQLRLINSVSDFGTLAGRGSGMAAIATNLRTGYNQLKTLNPSPDFAPLQDDALQTQMEAANAFDRLANGLNQSSDPEIYGAVATLEQVADRSEVSDKQAITDLAQTSPMLLQLAELPEKIEHVQER